MYILSVDTTAKSASVCISKDDEILGLVPVARANLDGALTHSECLLPMIDSCLSLARLSVGDIDYMAVTNGPGSFTGVRIGVCAISGLAFSQKKDIPCVPVSSLESLAENIVGYGESTVLCPLMDARREQFYNALFTVRGGKLKRLTPDRTVTADELCKEIEEKYSKKKIVICGDGARLFYTLMPKYAAFDKLSLCHPKDLYQSAFSVAVAAKRIIDADGFDGALYGYEKLSPSYLRLSQAERERNERLGK